MKYGDSEITIFQVLVVDLVPSQEFLKKEALL